MNERSAGVKIYEYKRDGFVSLHGKRVMALGFFDGVHIGHRELLDAARNRAARDGLPFAVFTFRSESKNIKTGARLYGTEEKLSLLTECGADEIVLADFEDLHGMSAEKFVYGLLIGECGCTVAVTGRDFRFGCGAAAGTQELGRMMREGGGDVLLVDDVTKFGKKVSTTAIKDYLAEGSIISANAMLGAPYFISAAVERGRGVGRTLGFPTLNCDLKENTGILRHGVYLSLAEIGNTKYPALTNVGTCPTFEERREHAEAFLLDFDGEVYGERVRIHLLRFVREERRFANADELTRQVKCDIEKAKKEFDEIWQATGQS